jgi:hypothetical protein
MDEVEWYGIWIGVEPMRRIELTYLGEPGSIEVRGPQFLVEASTPGFCAKFECDVDRRALATFLAQVREMHSALSGTATLQTPQNDLHIRGETNRYGHVLWRIELTYPDLEPARLTFEIREDQTMLWNVIAKAQRLLDVTKSRPEPA